MIRLAKGGAEEYTQTRAASAYPICQLTYPNG